MKGSFHVTLDRFEVVKLLTETSRTITSGVNVDIKVNGDGLEGITVSVPVANNYATNVVVEKAKEMLPKGFEAKSAQVDWSPNSVKVSFLS